MENGQKLLDDAVFLERDVDSIDDEDMGAGFELNDGEEYYIKTFLPDGFGNMKPYGKACEFHK